ncbi:MAG TPA: DNA-directed RNA polymerase subunit H [archaeon]|nr:DNA-directed RNA polymerase subunit H [archaeon]
MTTLNHALVPKHEILTAEDKEQLLVKLGAKEKQLPMIFIDDPAIKDMKPKAGDVIRITRESQTAGVTTYYRTVVD